MAAPSRSVRFYFSFRSPFAAIAFFRIRRIPQFQDVTFEPMPLWPEVVFGGHMDNPSDNLFKLAYIFQDAARQAQLAGLPAEPLLAVAERFELPEEADYTTAKVGLQLPAEPWAMPHGAFLLAQSRGLCWQFGEAVFNRRFDLDGGGSADVMNPDVLAAIAEDCGLDGQEAVAAHETEAIRATQQHCIKSSERDGVFGVPFFVFENDNRRHSYWGNDRLEHLLMALTGSASLPVIDAGALSAVPLR